MHIFSDLVFELRRLRLQEKPVTECERRQELEAMLKRRQLEADPIPPVSTEVSTTSSAQRPEAVLVEIRGLVEQRPVSSILGSQAFRQTLEEAVLRSSELARRPNSRRSRGVPATTNRNHAEQTRQSLSVGWGALGQSNSRVSSDIQDQEQWRSWNMNQVQRHTVAAEIGDLIQQHLVTSSLVSEFRGVLELHVQDRLQRSGGSGDDVQRFIQSLGRQQTRLSSGGLNPVAAQDLSREVQVMKADIEELKRMVRLSFQLQLDVQRAIRQEVAAVVNWGLSRYSEDVRATVPSQSSAVSSAGPCVICSEGVVDTLLYRCGHMCVCYSCAMELKSQRHNCPFCRAPIEDIVRAYQCQ